MTPSDVDRQKRDESAQERPAPSRTVFERPRLRRLGTLPAVTTAFGGSFTP